MKEKTIGFLGITLVIGILGILLVSSLSGLAITGKSNFAEKKSVDAKPFDGQKGDIIFIFDATGSMDWVISDMQSKALAIMNSIRDSITDTQFGVGSFTDYPGFYSSYGYSDYYGDSGDYPWCKNQELTNDINVVENAINNIVYGSGSDGPQDYTRVVYETLQFNWRDDAKKIVVLFGDAPPHSAPSGLDLKCPWDLSKNLFTAAYGGDPGVDQIMFTEDDLDYEPVVNTVAENGLIFVCVDCQESNDDDYYLDAHNNFNYLAYETGGSVFPYTSDEIAQYIINTVINQVNAYYYIQLTDTHIDTTWPDAGKDDLLRLTLDKIRTFNPAPAFLVISGDLGEAGNENWGGDYDKLIECFYGDGSQLYLDPEQTIPVYICPGNHDYRWSGYLHYYDEKLPYPGQNPDHHFNYYAMEPNEFIKVISLDTGCDSGIWDIGDMMLPEGDGLNSNEINLLDTELNTDNNKIIFMHHPVINYHTYEEFRWRWGIPPWEWVTVHVWDDGCFKNNQYTFMDRCEQYKVPLVLCGHTHGDTVYIRADDYVNGSGRSPDDYDDISGFFRTYCGDDYQKTLYVQTASVRDSTAYRIIKVLGDETKVYNSLDATQTSTVKICYSWLYEKSRNESHNITGVAQLHVYDSLGHHNGFNESGGMDKQINGSYSFLVGPDNITYGIQTTVLYGGENYTFEIHGLKNCSENESIYIERTTRRDKPYGVVQTDYLNISVGNISLKNGTNIMFYIYNNSINDILYMDMDGDTVIDKEIHPDNTTYEKVPYPPSKPVGQTVIDKGINYIYSSYTIDPEGDPIYYQFDWDDGNITDWIGLENSGENCTANHTWTTDGIYSIRVKAMDPMQYTSDWSSPLNVTTTTLPVIEDNTEIIGYTGDPFGFNATVTAYYNVSTVWVKYWYGSGTFTNISMNHIAGNYWERTITINNTLDTLHYIISANDTLNHWKSTGVRDVTIHDNDNPQIVVDYTSTVGYTGDPLIFNVTVMDNIQVSSVWVEYWYDSGDHTTQSMSHVTGDYWEETITIGNTLDTLYYIIIAYDSSNNWNTTGIKNVTIYDNDNPEIYNVIANPSEQFPDRYVNISAVVVDNIMVNEVYLSIQYPDTTIENFSILYNKTGDIYYCNKTYTQLGNYLFHLWVTDTSGNAVNSSDYSFKIRLNNPPNEPSNPNPENGATFIDVSKELSWNGSDPDGDLVTYDIYFGTTNPPPKVVGNQSSGTFHPGVMNYETIYYWRIVAWDKFDYSTTGEMWHFTTKMYLNLFFFAGFINNKNDTGDYLFFKARLLFVIDIDNIIPAFCKSGEEFMISKQNQLGFIGKQVIIGIFEGAALSASPSSTIHPFRDRIKQVIASGS
jgi:predicted MPP superfamily phosphohydrolase